MARWLGAGLAGLQVPGQLGQGDEQGAGPLELGQRLHFLFQVPRRHRRQRPAQLRLDGGQVGLGLGQPGVDQLVEQNRRPGELLGHPGAGPAQPAEALDDGCVFQQQRQVDAAPGDGFDHLEQPGQGPVRLVAATQRGQKPRHELLQALAPARAHGPHLGAAPEPVQALDGRGRILESQRRQARPVVVRGLRVLPEIEHRLGLPLVFRFLLRLEYRVEVPRHPAPVVFQCRGQRRPVVESHGRRDAPAGLFLRRQPVGLLVVQHLQAVLQPAQELVGRAQLLRGGRREQAALGQAFQDGQNPPVAQGRIPAAADELEYLGDELDLADAAGAQLDVFSQAAALYLRGDLALELPQRLEGREVQVAAIDEGPKHANEGLAGLAVACHRARLDPGVALPVAALALVIVLHGGEAQGQPAGLAVGPQP